MGVTRADISPSSFTLIPISPATGNQYRETLLAADIDKDGDIDFFSGEGRGDTSWWFEQLTTGWERHYVSDSNASDVGAVVLDVDGDGWLDKVSSGFWYRNPGFARDSMNPGEQKSGFETCRYSNLEFSHDMYLADFNGDGKKDFFAMDFGGMRWYRIPGKDSVCGVWDEHFINGPTLPNQHGGMAAGDLDGDGDVDVSRLDRWYENSDRKGLTWLEHVNIPIGELVQGDWGVSGRALILDMDDDGHQDILQAECDVPSGRVVWFSNPGGKGLDWVRHLVKDSADGQDYHSLLAEDFDGDGDRDLFSAGSNNSSGTPKAYIWENLDGKGAQWKEHVLLSGAVRLHDAAAVDIDVDGDIDILAKDWIEGTHFYLQNQKVPNALKARVSMRKSAPRNGLSTLGNPKQRLFTKGKKAATALGRTSP